MSKRGKCLIQGHEASCQESQGESTSLSIFNLVFFWPRLSIYRHWTFMLLSPRILFFLWKLLTKNPFFTENVTCNWKTHTRWPITLAPSTSAKFCLLWWEHRAQSKTLWISGCSSHQVKLHSKDIVPWNGHLSSSSLLLVLKTSALPTQMTFMCDRHFIW